MQETVLKRAKKSDPNDLSDVEIAAIKEYREIIKKKGKLITHEQLLKELGERCT